MGKCLSNTLATSTSLPWPFSCTEENINQKLSKPSPASPVHRKATHHWGLDNEPLFTAAHLCIMVQSIFIFFQGLDEWRFKDGQKGPREDIQGNFVGSMLSPFQFASVRVEKKSSYTHTHPTVFSIAFGQPGAGESSANTKYRCHKQHKLGKSHIFNLQYSNKQLTQITCL